MGVLVQGWEPDSPLMMALKVQPGGHLLTYADKKGVLLGERLAISLDKHVGDKMTLFDNETYTVMGIFKSGTVYENGSMTVLLKDLQRFMGREGQVSGFAIVVETSRGPGGNQANRPRHRGVRQERRSHAHRRVRRLDARNPVRPCHGLGHLGRGSGDRRRRHVEHHGDVGLRADQGDRHLAGHRLGTLARGANDPHGIDLAESHRRRWSAPRAPSG